MKINLGSSETFTIVADNVRGSIVVSNLGNGSMSVSGYQAGALIQLAEYPACVQPPEPSSTSILDDIVASCAGPAPTQNLRSMLEQAAETMSSTKISAQGRRNYAGFIRTHLAGQTPAPDFKDIANQLFDMLYDVLDPDGATDESLASLRTTACELLERVECEVKDK